MTSYHSTVGVHQNFAFYRQCNRVFFTMARKWTFDRQLLAGLRPNPQIIGNCIILKKLYSILKDNKTYITTIVVYLFKHLLH